MPDVTDRDPSWLSAPALRVRDVAIQRWVVALTAVAAAVQALAVWRVFSPPGLPAMRDSRIFEFFGWRIAQGDRLYLDLWEVKPPLPFEVTAALASLPVDPRTYHLLVVLVTGLAVVACVLLVAGHVHALTGDPLAAVIAGLALYTVPAFHLRAGFGFKAKYLVVAAGLGAVWLYRRDRPVAAGVLAAAAVGFWQFALAFPVVVVGMAARTGWRRGGRVVAGGALATAAVLAPVAWWGALEAMVVETVLVGLTVGTRGGLLGRLHIVPGVLDGGLPVFVVGFAGLGLVAWNGWHRRESAGAGEGWRRAWWLPACGGWFLAVALALDYDTFPDLFALLAVVAIGYGLVLARTDGRLRGVLVALVLVAALGSVVLLGNVGPLNGVEAPGSPEIAEPESVDAPYNMSEKRALLWYDIDPPTCHVFVARTESAWIRATGGDRLAEVCGDWP